MGGGAGLGLFSGTKGDRERDVFPGGRLVAAAAQIGTATDAGSKPTKAENTSSGGFWDYIRPWVTYPYGHPEKTQGIERLKGSLKNPLKGFASGFITMDKASPYTIIFNYWNDWYSAKKNKEKTKMAK